MFCAKATGEATMRAASASPGTVNFIEASLVELLINSEGR
jgi:hypothetical protein